MSAPVDLKNPGRALRVGVILIDSQVDPFLKALSSESHIITRSRKMLLTVVQYRVTEILDVAPIDLFTSISKEFTKDMPEYFMPQRFKQHAYDVEFHWVSATGGLMNLTSGIKLQATHSFDNCPPLDVVLMGAHNLAMEQPSDAELAFIRKSYEQCAAFMCICAGMMPPLQAGLLQGKTATAPLPMLDELRKQAPDVNWVAKRWANDGKLWTSGALLNGQDMMVAFAEHTWGKKAADGKPLEMVEHMIKLGGWPVRDVDYKDTAF
ncbi:class I glutamine amidotransferase-like protein [Microdochium bolleyi]|uniref:Class I glutamine amidotransferase-like protein n=1 Tax=Microdochium bolleyi TaxID=196109 RepID=A0A136JHA4_9PEZI|nr:class I glutamine amidotransferase-like protein [Microdochium bolleyi]